MHEDFVDGFIKIAPFETSFESKYVARIDKVSEVLETGNAQSISPYDLFVFQIPHCYTQIAIQAPSTP